MKAVTFVLHDESLNTKGFRMLTSGANLAEFRANPVMLLNHDDWTLPIGRWDNIRVDGNRILADAVFDDEDKKALDIKRKVEQGFLRMASIGAWPPEEVSDAFGLMLPGQSLPTVTKWTVREGSIVTIGANHNALAFYDRDNKRIIDIDDKSNLIKLMDHSINQNKRLKMSVLTGILKLHDSANEAEIVTAVQHVIANSDRLAKENETLKESIDVVNKQRKESRHQEAVALADAAIKDGRYDANGRDALLELFDADWERTKAMLAAIPKRSSVTSAIDNGKNVGLGDYLGKTWDELDKAGKLLELKDSNPELYKTKFTERFGVEPKM